MSDFLLGVDVGGTKCAVVLGKREYGNLCILDKVRFETTEVTSTIENILSSLEYIISRSGLDKSDIKAVGISCGGPLDSVKGVVMSPPNLPGWDNIPIVNLVKDRVGIKAALENDANACALAEWKFGAGKDTDNMVFLTFGTGLGAGLIINGKLYSGTNGNAGELGHIRLNDFGPVGYGKQGSFEGFASGGGIAQLARSYIMESYQQGRKVDWCPVSKILSVTAKDVAEAAHTGDSLALEIFRMSATYLGKGLSVVIDILNPQAIIIGSIYARNEELMKPIVEEIIAKEALGGAASVCKILPAALGEKIGDYAAVSIAANLIDAEL